MKSHGRTIKDISEFLSSKGIKPSYQRVKILERMYKMKDHPTVNDIYKDLDKASDVYFNRFKQVIEQDL